MSDSVPEFSRIADIRAIDSAPLHLVASAEECAALARRFAIVLVQRLEARIALEKHGEAVAATGTMDAQFVQSCAISAEDMPVTVHETLNLRFVPANAAPRSEAEIELDAADLDVIDYTGTSFDLGEAVAQSLALAIDPFAIGPEAERARAAAGIVDESASGPFAALAGLKITKE